MKIEENTITLRGGRIIDLTKVRMVMADGNSTVFMMVDYSEPVRCAITLGEFEKLLCEREDYVRMDRTFIINIKHVKETHFHARGGHVNLEPDDVGIEVSRRKVASVKRKVLKYRTRHYFDRKRILVDIETSGLSSNSFINIQKPIETNDNSTNN